MTSINSLTTKNDFQDVRLKLLLAIKLFNHDYGGTPEKFLRGCLVSDYDDHNRSWENVKLLESSGIPNSCNDVQVECCSFSPCGKYIAICFSKYLIIYTTNNWSFLSSVTTERKGVSVRFFPKSNVILLAEKSGSIRLFKYYENRIEKVDVSLGHNSMLIEALITKDEYFIITCDKDEKIRVTNYPNVYNIQCYCLGHTQFVCSINFLQSDENILISSSGDKTIRLWEITTGKELFKYTDSEAIKKETANNTDFYIKITSIAFDENHSLIAALKPNSNYVILLKVTGNIKSNINMEPLKTIKNIASPYDIEFWQGNLVCLVQDEKNPVIIYNVHDNFAENNVNCTNLIFKITEYWNLILSFCQKRTNMFQLMFQYKKVADTSDEVKSKKIKV